MPSLSSEQTRSMCCLRVSGFWTEITQQIHSLRASGVMSSHFARAIASEVRAFRKSAGTLCTAPAEMAFLVTDFILLPLCCTSFFLSSNSWAVTFFFFSLPDSHGFGLIPAPGSRAASALPVPPLDDWVPSRKAAACFGSRSHSLCGASTKRASKTRCTYMLSRIALGGSSLDRRLLELGLFS